jgi:polyisoprenoid-binding protein YceI
MHRTYLTSLAFTLTLLATACSPAAQSEATATATALSTPAPALSTPSTESMAPAVPTATAATIQPSATDPAPDSRLAAPEETRFAIVPDETTASYSIEETFINQNNRVGTAVGKTNAVQGELTLNYEDPSASQFGQFVVDISTLTSDRPRRDNAIREQWLESASYPLTTFVVKEVRGFPADAQEGQSIQFQLVGDMTLKETTRPATWDVTATLAGDRLTGQATTFIMLQDYNVPPPSIAGILSVTDGAQLTLDFTLEAAG